ncbi:MAG: hypothetical protein MZV49_12150 [Rhodopseudomonas palustris]|nr:hypothetical protein [Rhodopseudomonas palustris]
MSTTVAPLFHELVAALEEAVNHLETAERVSPYQCDHDYCPPEDMTINRLRAVIAKAKSGQPLITVSPSMIDAAQDEFIAQWRLGASPDGAVSAAVRAAVNHINNSIKERVNEQA